MKKSKSLFSQLYKKAILYGLVDEGGWFPHPLRGRKNIAEYTKLTKNSVNSVSSVAKKSRSEAQTRRSLGVDGRYPVKKNSSCLAGFVAKKFSAFSASPAVKKVCVTCAALRSPRVLLPLGSSGGEICVKKQCKSAQPPRLAATRQQRGCKSAQPPRLLVEDKCGGVAKSGSIKTTKLCETNPISEMPEMNLTLYFTMTNSQKL